MKQFVNIPCRTHEADLTTYTLPEGSFKPLVLPKGIREVPRNTLMFAEVFLDDVNEGLKLQIYDLRQRRELVMESQDLAESELEEIDTQMNVLLKEAYEIHLETLDGRCALLREGVRFRWVPRTAIVYNLNKPRA